MRTAQRTSNPSRAAEKRRLIREYRQRAVEDPFNIAPAACLLRAHVLFVWVQPPSRSAKRLLPFLTGCRQGEADQLTIDAWPVMKIQLIRCGGGDL
ncbi:hypothetical protein predicted by Glimmer/Critica [Sorangium cellulosum So ce56]|uniref:Uncharacterized protein n=1 Tax=Sorangium cellulosum (strain So ce56) TaxID=448385 RepID=A9GI59_SORC5|nr:hypothetical protein predicted by Glimmer/Critica [Sorangium cellulosum So ce56]